MGKAAKDAVGGMFEAISEALANGEKHGYRDSARLPPRTGRRAPRETCERARM